MKHRTPFREIFLSLPTRLDFPLLIVVALPIALLITFLLFYYCFP